MEPLSYPVRHAYPAIYTPSKRGWVDPTLKEYFGERIALSAKKTTLRRIEPNVLLFDRLRNDIGLFRNDIKPVVAFIDKKTFDVVRNGTERISIGYCCG